MRAVIWFSIFGLWFEHGNAQQKTIGKIPEQSFVSFSDSILATRDVHNELAVIYNRAENKKIVAIGEVTHGTNEVLGFQHLIAENLLKLHNFNCIVLGEVSLIDAYKINEYVVNEKETPNNLTIKGKPKPREMAYRQADMLAFYERVRDFNKARARSHKIWVVGADIDEPDDILRFVRGHCGSYKMNDAEAIAEKLYVNLKKKRQGRNVSINTIAENAGQLAEIIDRSRNGVDSTTMKIDLMVHLLKILPELLVFSADADFKYKMRDKFIYRNINWLLEDCKREKIVLIKTHNFHVNKKTIYTEIFGKFRTLGEYLNEHYGEAYLCIGTEVQQGRFYTGASGYARIAQHKNKLGTIIGSHTKALYGVLLFDASTKEFLNKIQYSISYGTINYGASLLVQGKSLLGDAFDMLIFIKNSSPYANK